MRGKLIVIDGIDGSGKTTQIELLKQYYARKGTPFEAISFPRYGENVYADLITRYLDGELGSINDVNPYLVALAYAGDRLVAKPLIESWLNEGKIVLANRYVSASKSHLGANLADEEREEFFKWLDELEYQENGMPRPDLTILLTVDPKVGQQNALDKTKPDIHEKNLKHEERAARIYLELSQNEPNWVVVDCMENGKMKSKEEIHQEIVAVLKGKIF